MKYLGLILLLSTTVLAADLGFAKFRNKKKVAQIEQDLFPLIIPHEVGGKLKCEPSFVTLRDEELVVYCLPVDQTDPGMIEQLRQDITTITSEWVIKDKLVLKHIGTRFTDEIVTTEKK